MLKLRLNHPQAAAPNAGGVGKIAFFDQARNLRLRRIIADLYPCITTLRVDNVAGASVMQTTALDRRSLDYITE